MYNLPNIAPKGNDPQTAMPSDYDFGFSPDDPLHYWNYDCSGVLQQAFTVAGADAQQRKQAEEAARDADYLKRSKALDFFGDNPNPKPRRKPKSKPQLFRAQTLTRPPGFAGEIAQYIFDTAMRPVGEVAIVATLGLLAGICGRQWQIPQSGLNIYVVLVARSAIGKEAMHSGISSIIKGCSKIDPAFGNFIDFNEYASGPALTKGCVAQSCFVNVSGELGRKIKRMADNKDPSLQTLRTQMTNLYTKSGQTSISGGISYSATDNNVASLNCVAYSVIGETTPGTFLESLTSEMMEDGFMSRLTVIEYEGERPEKNRPKFTEPPAQLAERIAGLATYANLLNSKEGFLLVQRSPAAAAFLDLFNLDCDVQLDGLHDESKRQMWNRAHLKALRIAALLAVADNHIVPIISYEHALWAINLVLSDIACFTKRLDKGDVGAGGNAQELKLITILKEYLGLPVPDSYKVKDEMRQNTLVPRSYLHTRVGHLPAFNPPNTKSGRILDDTIASMIANGYLMEADKDKVAIEYSYFGKSYRVIRLPDADQGD